MKILKILGIILSLFFMIACGSGVNNDDFDFNDPNAGGGGGEETKTPPFSGTIFIDKDILKSTDPTAFLDITYSGQGSRTMFDRRVDGWITVNAFLFDVRFDDDLSTEIQVNPEFQNKELAEIEANKYAKEIGRLPKILRTDVKTVWIHKGVKPFGGGNDNILIHTGQSVEYENEGILEETLIHEASHTSLDEDHATASGWVSSQKADGNYISTYAKDFPEREDVAESFLVYLAVKYKSSRISEELKKTINETIPNRIDYFNDQSFEMHPIE